MSEKDRGARTDEDVTLEREVRAHRKYSLAEAIGRAAGDLMKGASPVTRERQAGLEIEQYLASHLTDAEGALTVVLGRRALASEALLERSYEEPLEALAEAAEELLASPPRLRRFVRDVDAEWGRIYSERPYFQLGDSPPRPGDPYTVESVRDALSGLLARLRATGGG